MVTFYVGFQEVQQGNQIQLQYTLQLVPDSFKKRGMMNHFCELIQQQLTGLAFFFTCTGLSNCTEAQQATSVD